MQQLSELLRKLHGLKLNYMSVSNFSQGAGKQVCRSNTDVLLKLNQSIQGPVATGYYY